MIKYKSEMYKEALKDYFLYRIPNHILIKCLKTGTRCNFLYDKLKSNQKHSVDFIQLLALMAGLIVSLFCFPIIVVYLFIQIYFNGKIFIHRVEVAMTTCCTLKCKSCSNLMQYYEQPYHVDYNMLISSIEGLLEVVDSLENIVFLGGEPFLYPQFAEIIEFALNCSKIKNIQIITNGIIKVNPTFLRLLGNDKILISISDYGVMKNRVIQTGELFDKYGISYARIEQKKWFDFGDVSNKNRPEESLIKQFKDCGFKCKCILNGKMYVCPRASHGTDLGFYEDKTYVDLLVKDKTNKMDELMKVYYGDQYIEACKYCDAGTEECKIIDCGEQR